VRDRAVEVDGRRVKLDSGDWLEPDYLMLATGSWYPFPAKTEEPDIASARPRRGHPSAHHRRRGAHELQGIPTDDRDPARPEGGAGSLGEGVADVGGGNARLFGGDPRHVAVCVGEITDCEYARLTDDAKAATIAEIKGRDMLLGHYAELFDSAPMPA
jgi:hypothetical protein